MHHSMGIASVLAATIITGNATAQTTVRTSVGGDNAKVNTTITTNINGEEHTVVSSSPGTLRVEADESGVSVSQEPAATSEQKSFSHVLETLYAKLIRFFSNLFHNRT